MNEVRLRILVGLVLGIVLAAPSAAPGQSATEPLTLRKAVQLALERAPQLAALRAGREGEVASAELAGDAYHPSLWLTTSPGYTYGMPATVAGHVPSVVGVEFRQTIYDPYRRSEVYQAEARAGARGPRSGGRRDCKKARGLGPLLRTRRWRSGAPPRRGEFASASRLWRRAPDQLTWNAPDSGGIARRSS
jgi:hypothetical protein